jgi:UDP-N-acetylmuramoylalanine--D-glutamate ligase
MSAGVDLLAMNETRLTRQDPELAGLRVLVVGAGKSGLAAARLAAGRGAHVTLCDREHARRLAHASREADRLQITLHCGGHPPTLADSADLLVVSPGVPADVPLLERARERGLPVWGEVELAARFCRGRIIGVTGSNGKSTVTTMVGGILRGAGIAGGTGGNLDRPLSDLLEQDAPDAWHALELSSFQLETVETLRAHVAVMLNLSADHLDRHSSLEAYAQAKTRLLELQHTDDYAVLNADDAESARFSPAVRGRLHLFSTREAPAPGACLHRGRLTLNTEHGEDDLLAVDELPVPGAHNVANALAAALACRLAGCTPEAIARGLLEYRSLPHRLELVGQSGGVYFYNDSKATNPASAACALAAFPAGSIHLILGGRDKLAAWDALVRLVRSHAKRVLLVGEAAPQLERLLRGAVPLQISQTVPRAVEDALEQARPGDVVLLAPGCASFDQYTDFAERGDDFRNAVLARIDRNPGASDG